MKHNGHQVNPDAGVTYQIKVKGSLDGHLHPSLSGSIIVVERARDGALVSTLSGSVADQAAVYGLLRRLEDLGLPLLSIHCIGP